MNRFQTLLGPFHPWLLAVVFLPVVLAVVGCGGDHTTSPKTYLVTGTVRYKGGERMRGGAIQLQPTTASPFSIRGDIKEDGTFALITFLESGQKQAGAVPGEYRVMIVPPQGPDQVIEPVRPVQPLFRVEPKEDNRLDIEVERVPPSR